MSWLLASPGHQQPWDWHSKPFWFQQRYAINVKRCTPLKTFLMEDNDLCTYTSSILYHWWPGDKRSQGISSHNIQENYNYLCHFRAKKWEKMHFFAFSKQFRTISYGPRQNPHSHSGWVNHHTTEVDWMPDYNQHELKSTLIYAIHRVYTHQWMVNIT